MLINNADDENGLFYNYFRYYDPKTGRYITSDPIGLEGGLNTYNYVYSSPLHYRDPNGQVALIAPTVAVGIITIGIGYKLFYPKPQLTIPPSKPLDLGSLSDKPNFSEQCPATVMASAGKWSCTASCNVQVINTALDGIAPSRVTGSARGKTQPDACATAKRKATQSAPLGTYARHCKCTCSKK